MAKEDEGGLLEAMVLEKRRVGLDHSGVGDSVHKGR